VINAFKYGLVTQRLLQRLRRLGINIRPYLLIREGVRPHRTDWPELAREFPSEVLDASDTAAIAEMATFDRWRTVEEIRGRLAKGHLCVVLKKNGGVAGFAWADPDEVNDATCDYALGTSEAYLYDAFVAPRFRGRELAVYMRTESYKHLRRLGRSTFYCICEYFNTPALKFKDKLGADRVALYVQIEIGDFELLHWRLRTYDWRWAKAFSSVVLFHASGLSSLLA
jgi:ribosomal protein S18 acetylase RimI-like enzyme